MGLISDLLGAIGGKKARTIADVEAALARLADERAMARQAISDAMRQRDDLLLVDGSDGEITKLDGAADRHRITLERIDAVEPRLLAELQSLRTAARQASWRELRAAYDEGSIDYSAALGVAFAKMTKLLSLNEQARGLGYEREVMSSFIPPLRTLTPEAIAQYEIAIEKARELARPNPPPAPVAPTPKPVAVATSIKPKPAPVAVAPPKPAPPPKPPFKPTVDADGNIGVLFLKDGYELPDGSRPKVDEIVKLPETIAFAVVKARVAEFEGALQ